MFLPNLLSDGLLLALDLVASWQIEKVLQRPTWKAWEMHLIAHGLASICIDEDENQNDEAIKEPIQWEGVALNLYFHGEDCSSNRVGEDIEMVRLEVDINDDGYVLVVWALPKLKVLRNNPSIHALGVKHGYSQQRCGKINQKGVCMKTRHIASVYADL